MATRCPECGHNDVDLIDGRNVCQGCGVVISDEALDCSLQLGPEGEQYGHFVSTNGRVTGGDLKNWRVRSLVKHGEDYEMPSSMRAGMTQLAQQLGCNTDVTEDASFTLKQAYHLLSGKGCMPLDIMTAATLYLTVRLANLPYTLAETARLAGRPTHVLVAAYKKVAVALDMQMRQQQKEHSSTDHSNTEKEDEHEEDLKQINQPPPVDFANFAHRHLCTMPNLKCSAAQNRLIADHFVQLMAWIEQTQSMGRHPSLMAAALQLAAEACKVKMPTRSLATAFFVNTISVTKHVSQIRDALLVSAAKLPWLKCTGKNVTQHMRTILRVSVPQQSLEGAPPLADPLSSGQSGPVRHIGSGAEAVHATATACSHHGASKSVHWVLPASKKRARQVDSESEVEPEACSAEQKSPRPQGKKHAGPSSDPSQGDSLTSHGSQGCEGQPPAPHAEDDSLDDAIIPEHEWSTYMRSAPEMELHSLLQHVQ